MNYRGNICIEQYEDNSKIEKLPKTNLTTMYPKWFITRTPTMNHLEISSENRNKR